MVAICVQLNTNPSRAGLSPVVVDLIDSDGHSTGSEKQAVPSVPCYRLWQERVAAARITRMLP